MKNAWKDRFYALLENKTRRAIALALAVIVTFSTTYSLILPAITLEKETAETMSGISLGGSEQEGNASTSSSEEDSSDSDTVSFDAEAKNEAGETEALVHVEADANAFPEGTTMEAAVVTDQDVLDSIAEAAEDEVVSVHAVDLTFSDEDGEPVQPAEGSQVSVTISAGDGNSSDVQDRENSGTDAPDGQATETTVVQYSEENGAEQIETADDISFRVEPENDLDQDSAVSFELGEQTGEQETQTYAIVETVTEEDVKDNSFTDKTDEANSVASGDAAVPETEEPATEEQAPVPAELPEEANESVLTAQGDSYFITMTCGPEAQIPQGASLQVEEILSENKAYDDHLEETQKVLNETGRTETPEAGVYAGPSAEEPQFFGARSLMADPDGFDRQQAEADPAPETEIVFARFFDITIVDADGNEVEPAAPVKVSIELMNAQQEEQVIQNSDAAQVVHFGKETEVVEAEVIQDTVAGVTFDAAGFSVYGVVYTKVTEITGTVITDSGDAYEVTVTYPESANIPEGSTLRVTEFKEDTDDYAYARSAVLADKKARGEQVDLSSFNLAALDISIIDPDGNEIEPSAVVQVDIRIKELPGVEDLSEVADTLTVQHHVEVDDGVVVETVFEGGSDASFRMKTNETVAADGTAVDPNSVNEEEYIVPDLSQDAEDGDIDVSFQTAVFSTFTVTWGTQSSEGYRMNLDGKSFVLVNESHSAALVAENITVNNQQRLKAVQYSSTDDSITKWYFQRVNNNDWYYYISDGNGHYLNIGNENSSYVRVSDTSQQIYIDRYNSLFRFQRSNDYYSTAVNLYGGNIGSGFGPYNDRGENEWFRAYYPSSANKATIHYVDEVGNELSVSKGSISSATLLNNYAYLIYDIEGGEYEYKETYIRRNSTDTPIRAYLHWNGTNWRYTTNGDNWLNVNDNDDIYVVYKKKTTPTKGGTPTLVELDENQKPEKPTVTKDSTVNGDGTNTLSLSVTSHTKPREVLKLADVIVIFDRSGSMKRNINNSNDASTTAARRMTLLQNAINSLADDLIGDNSAYIYTDKNGEKHKQIEMSLVSFSTTATEATSFTDNAGTFKGWVNALSPEGGTNWEQALQKANEASVDSGRATFVIFVTDGEPTFRMSRMTDPDSSLTDDMYFPNSNTYYGTYYRDNNVYGTGYSDNQKDGTEYGRNYRAALAQALSIVDKNKNLYMIGIGPEVGNLEKFNTDAGAAGYFPATSSDALTKAFADIKKKIAATAGYSDFQISDGITDLTQTVRKSQFVNFAEDDFTYYKGKVDHIATQAEVDAGHAQKVGDPVVLAWESWDPASEGCAEAEYKDGAVVWNMGTDFMPQEGYTYQVRFKVWPSQKAYDLLADLNNGVKTYSDLSQAEKDQIKEPKNPIADGGMYTLKTNSKTSYNYKDATIVDGTVTPNGNDLLTPAGKFDDVDPLELTTRPLKVKKQWENNYVDSRGLTDSITMELYASDLTEDDTFKTITLKRVYKMVGDHYVDKDGAALNYNETTKQYEYADGTAGIPAEAENSWYDEENYVSYGLVTYDAATNAGEKIYETGHDFTLREIDDEAHYYELTAGVFRPMVINNVPTILEKVDAAPAGMIDSVFHYSDGPHHYYRLDGKIYRDTKSDILLIATNSHRSYMDLKKVVVDESNEKVADDTEFEYNITFTVPSDIANFDTVEKYIWFSVYDTIAGRTLNPSEYTSTGVIKPYQENPSFSGPEYANYLVATSGVEMTLKIKQGWSVRFLNLPIGTTYSFEEINIPTGYDFVKAEVSGTQWIANMVNGIDQGHAVDMTSLPANTSGINTNTVITGSIERANARYSTTYTNKALTQSVNILKTGQDGNTPLPGAVFSLYTKSGYEADQKVPAKTDLTSDNSGIIDLGRLSNGTYYLEETKAPDGYNLLSAPVIITVSSTGVTYQQKESNLSLSQGGVAFNQETGVYTLTVINLAGYELPSTGGSGTGLFMVLGSVLTAGAGALLWKRRLFF